MKPELLIPLFLGALFSSTDPALPQDTNCAPREKVVARLAERFGEARQSRGLSSGQALVELFASPETGTWTIVVTRPDGLTCLLAAGHSIQMSNGLMAALGTDA